MPVNKKEGIIFGVTMCFLMVCGMRAYNLTLVGKLSLHKVMDTLLKSFDCTFQIFVIFIFYCSFIYAISLIS